ncbi:MAG: copper chaperone PCu(A)C [Gammaproteobacteria bacterium]|nr:copper chaperone PCu(A)C [Gammaproteobacteria bacterium]
MKHAVSAVFSVVAGLALGLSVAYPVAAEGIADKVTVTDPYVRAIPPVIKTTAAFMQLRSSDAVERFVVEASSPAAGTVELHMHTMDDGVMRMRRIAHIHLPSNQQVSLEPGGLHIMLFDLTAPIAPGDRIPITLTFDDGSTREISAEVRTVESMMKH